MFLSLRVIYPEDEQVSESSQSEVAWEGPLGGANRAWFRAVVDGGLVLLRRLKAAELNKSNVLIRIGLC